MFPDILHSRDLKILKTRCITDFIKTPTVIRTYHKKIIVNCKSYFLSILTVQKHKLKIAQLNMPLQIIVKLQAHVNQIHKVLLDLQLFN
jgi:hypothetical protein